MATIAATRCSQTCRRCPRTTAACTGIRVIETYVPVIDHKYYEFQRNLSREMKSTNFGLDIGLLALTGTASVWSHAAEELSAAATGLAGVKANFNRELYAEKTMPVLVSLMTSHRMTVLADIKRGEKQAEKDYPIEQAFADLDRYQAAASLDGAVQKAAGSAAVEAQAAKYDYSLALDVCQASDDVANVRRAYFTQLARGRDTQEGRARINRAAVAAGMPASVAASDDAALAKQGEAVSAYLLTLCTTADLDAYKKKVDTDPAPAAGAGT